MRIGVIGGEIVGLSFSLLCEKNGHDVTFSDSDENFIFNLKNKICLTNEPSVQSMLFDTTKFTATTENLKLIKNSDFIFTFVPTPSSLDVNFDTSKIFDVISNFYSASSLEIPMYDKKFIVCSSTNPGDVEQIQERLRVFNIEVAYVPEFTTQGEIVKSFEQSDVVLIGTEYQQLSTQLINLYSKIQKTPLNAYVMTIKAAEITKMAISGLIATKITYANMLGNLLVKSGLESETNMVLSAIGGDSKIDKKYLKFGFGFGGPTIPKENRIFGNYLKSFNVDTNIPTTIDSFNREHASFLKKYYIEKNPNKSVPFVMNHITYKNGVNSIEESQQFQLCVDLLNEGYMLHVIESDEICKKLNSLSESYNERLKFFKPGTNPEGYKIKL